MNIELLRQQIETPFNPGITLDDFLLSNPPILQRQQNLSLVQIYSLAIMLQGNKDYLTLNEILDAEQMSNLHDLQMFAELKGKVWNKPGDRADKTYDVQEVLSLPSRRRMTKPINFGTNVVARTRLWMKAMKIHQKHLSTYDLKDRTLFAPRIVEVMTFEIDHLDALRCEPTLYRELEARRAVAIDSLWPKAAKEQNLLFGWIFFETHSDGSKTIHEIQSFVEHGDRFGDKFHMFAEMTWSGFMLEQFLQYFILRGVSNFRIPTVELLTNDGSKTTETYYRQLPRAFSFKKNPNWWTLSFSPCTISKWMEEEPHRRLPLSQNAELNRPRLASKRRRYVQTESPLEVA